MNIHLMTRESNPRVTEQETMTNSSSNIYRKARALCEDRREWLRCSISRQRGETWAEVWLDKETKRCRVVT